MKIDCDEFRIKPREQVDLSRRPTRVAPLYRSRKHYQHVIDGKIEELTVQQRLLYANDTHSLLLIFQAMDAAGKDSAITHVMSGVNPQGCQVHSFKHPTPAELSHDFLWRTTGDLPSRGQIGIFNRSYYEEVLIVRVQREILEAERLPRESSTGEALWQQRYESISGFEKHLHRNGTRVIKFFLHLSKEEQRLRLLKRIDEPDKNWKFSGADLEQRKCWKEYQSAYEACLGATSSKEAPWFAVPADDKKNAHLIISQIILDSLSSLKMRYPHSNRARRQELKAFRKELGR
jgi:PPK2 family polyphosphate:nucleotide phosphotransferase